MIRNLLSEIHWIFFILSQYNELNIDEMYFMLDSMIRYDQINSTFEKWYLEDARNFAAFVKTSDLLRLFRSVSSIINPYIYYFSRN